MDIITSIIQDTGYFYEPVKKFLDAGKIDEETKKAIFSKELKEERKRVQPIYNTEGKLIEYDSHGKHLDIKT